MELGSYFLFLQEQIKEIIIKAHVMMLPSCPCDDVVYWYLIQ